MTKKDYIILAMLINRYSEVCGNVDMCGNAQRFINKDKFINELCGVLKEDNKLFNKDRFIEACNDW